MTFAEVLDETLGAYRPEPAASHHPRGCRTAPLHPFVFNRMDVPGPSPVAWARGVTTPEAATMRPVGRSTRAAGLQGAASAPPPEIPAAATAARTAPAATPGRPVRRLTVAQRRSLDVLIGFGAALHAGFSPGELRSAFRTLGLAYHPDRHPFAGDSEKAALGRHFSAIAASYETLLTALEDPTS